MVAEDRQVASEAERAGARGSDGFELRSLSSEGDFEQCLELQRLTWGHDFRELVPPTILAISQRVGGILAGAFAGDGRLLGFVYGLTGVRDDRLAHWSHMLAVREEARGLGLGRRLKLYQREKLLALGCEHMYWTFDPLVARNANLNLGRLGALPCEYVVDMYGSQTGSELHSGLGTDRFVVEWRFADPEVAHRLQGGEGWKVDSPTEGSLVIEPEDAAPRSDDDRSAESAESVAEIEARRPDRFWVRIPLDIERLKREDRPAALRWRDALRGAMVWAFAAGYRVSGLAGDLRSGGPVWYRLDQNGT